MENFQREIVIRDSSSGKIVILYVTASGEVVKAKVLRASPEKRKLIIDGTNNVFYGFSSSFISSLNRAKPAQSS